MAAILQNRQPARLRIKVLNSTKRLTDIPVSYTIVHSGSETQESGRAQLDNNGEAIIILKENLSYQQVWLYVDSLFYAGLLVNSDLDVKVDAAQINEEVFLSGKGVTLSGSEAALNEQLMQRVLFKRKEKAGLQNEFVEACIGAANNNIKLQQFLKTADSVYTVLKNLDDDFLKEKPGFDWAVENERNSYFFEWLIVAFNNKDIPAEWSTKISQHQPYFTTNEGVGFYRNLSSHLARKKNTDTTSLQTKLYKNSLSPEQHSLLDSIRFYESSPGPEKSGTLKLLYAKRAKLFKTELEKIEIHQSLLSIQQNSEGARADILKLALMERWKDKFEYVYPTIIGSIETNWIKRFIQAKYEQALATQQQIENLFKTSSLIKQSDNYYIGKPLAELSFGAQLYKLDSLGKIEDLISNLRLKFSNKVLVLDIWATWCAPCISDIPNSIRLHKENGDLPIEYVYLCTNSGSDEKTWKSRIGMLKPPGTHIFIDEALLNSLRKALRAEGGFPTYVVIDRQGKVNSKAISFMGGLDRDKLKTATNIE
jgi:thiol-disulfide isomerase/thioredoxin